MFLAEQCPNFLSVSSEGSFEVVALPVGECSKCGNTFSLYHTCEVKLFTLSRV